MLTREIMTPNAACCTPDSPLERVASMMVDCNCGEIPVVDSLRSMRPMGVVTDRDICVRTVALGRNPLELTARDCMTSPCITIREDASLDECVDLMERHRIRRVPVVDASGRCCGIVAQADLARKMDEVAAEVLREVSQPTRDSRL